MATNGNDRRRLEVWTDFVLAYNQLIRLLESEMEGSVGISLSQYDVLLRLSEAPGRRMRMTDLADAILYTTGGLTRLFERMVSAGIVRRVPSDEDRRVVYAEMTDEGSAVLRAASKAHVDGVRRHFGAHLSDEDVVRVGSFLARLEHAAQSCEAGDPGVDSERGSNGGRRPGTTQPAAIRYPNRDQTSPRLRRPRLATRR
jgi:DNA-binding MarR family transcriptional regulator